MPFHFLDYQTLDVQGETGNSLLSIQEVVLDLSLNW